MSFFDTLKKGFENMGMNFTPFDPSVFDDPLALKTSWEPAARGGTNICTHRLKHISDQRVEFKVRVLVLLFPLFAMGMGFVSFVFLTLAGVNGPGFFLIAGPIFGGVFFFSGFFLLRSLLKPRVFDKVAGFYWRRRAQPKPHTPPDAKDSCRLCDVNALQILAEWVIPRSSNSSNHHRSRPYKSYELNLVLKDGRRLNVVDHGKLSALRNDADSLGSFLSVPVWDSTWR